VSITSSTQTETEDKKSNDGVDVTDGATIAKEEDEKKEG